MTATATEPRADAISAALNAITLGGDLTTVFASLTPSERAALAKILEDRRLAMEWRKKARKKQLPPWDPSKTLASWGGYIGHPPGCSGPETCNLGAPESPEEDVRYCDHRFGRHTYRTCYKQGGRGAGKTFAGAGMLCELILWLGGTDKDGNQRQYAIVGPTHNTAWDVCVEQGIKRILGDRIVKDNKSDGILEIDNGAIIYVTGAKTGAPNLQGKNLTAVWADEIGVWEINPWFKAWVEGIEFATRKTPHLVIATGTPKQGHPLVAYLVNDSTVHRVVMPTKDNRKNLGPAFLARITAAFGNGARIGKQELDGEFLTDTPGALWSLGLIDSNRVGPEGPPTFNSDGEVVDPGYSLPDLKRIVVGWDPSNTANSGSDEHGIEVAGIDENDEVYAIADYSGVYSPDEACRKVAWALDVHLADVVAVEKNGAEDWIFTTVEQTVPSLTSKIKKVNSRRGKYARAEPIVAITEQGRFHMLRKDVVDGDHGSLVDHFAALIGQMTTWLPTSKKSPDRMDALVHAVTELLDGDGGSAGSHVIVPGQSQGRGFLGAGRSRRR